MSGSLTIGFLVTLSFSFGTAASVQKRINSVHSAALSLRRPAFSYCYYTSTYHRSKTGFQTQEKKQKKAAILYQKRKKISSRRKAHREEPYSSSTTVRNCLNLKLAAQDISNLCLYEKLGRLTCMLTYSQQHLISAKGIDREANLLNSLVKSQENRLSCIKYQLFYCLLASL